MELGIHNSDVIKHDLASEAQRKEASILMCCVIVFDRQWSAMTGLLPNFAHNTFSLKSTHLVSASVLTWKSLMLVISGDART
jgi:hypothetical protein